jgi:hypothetical protein
MYQNIFKVKKIQTFLKQFITFVLTAHIIFTSIFGSTAFGNTNVQAQADTKFGVQVHPSWNLQIDDQKLARTKDIGAKVVRLGLSWRLLEPNQKGVYDYNWYIPAFDNLIEDYYSNGVEILLMMGENPCWASDDPDKNCQNYDFDFWCPSQREQDYAEAFDFVVSRYKDKVSAFEVWNEPNVPQFWCNQSQPLASEYQSLLSTTYNQVKPKYPQETILGVSLAGTDTDYLNKLYQNGLKGSYDGLAIHPYTGTADIDDCGNPRWSYICGVEAVRNMQAKNQDLKDIWFTEMGWSNCDCWGGVDSDLQAQYLEDSFEQAKRWDYVPVAIWYNLFDLDYHSSYREANFGLYQKENPTTYVKKPVADSFYNYTL